MPHFRLTLEYDGTDFEGWQAQARPGHRTVQETLEAALRRVSGRDCAVVGAGRTDAGVHAEAQVAGARVETELAPEALARALNALLPRDLAVVHAEAVAADFHARRDARAKLYRYRVWNGPFRSPLRDRTHLHVSRPLDLAAMRSGAVCLVGTHDFAAFRAAGSSARTSVRSVHSLELEGAPGAEVCFWVAGSGFLRHMVRNLVGTLLQVGRGKRPAEDVARVLAGRERDAAGPTAPARGLALVRVEY